MIKLFFKEYKKTDKNISLFYYFFPYVKITNKKQKKASKRNT